MATSHEDRSEGSPSRNRSASNRGDKRGSNRGEKGYKAFKSGEKRSDRAPSARGSRSATGGSRGKPSNSTRKPFKSDARVDRPLRKPRIEPLLPEDVEAKMLPGKIRAELLSLSAENSEVVAKQMVMIDRLLSTHVEADERLANQFGKAASERAGRVGVVRDYAGRAALAVKDFPEAKKHFSAAFRINGNPMMKVYLAECETGLGKARKALDLLGEIKLASLTPRDAAYAHMVSAEARFALAQMEAALVTLSAKYEEVLSRIPEDRALSRWIALKTKIKAQL